MSRQQVVERIERLVGPPLSITDPADGWPALGSVRTVERTLPVALFVGLVHLSHRGRDQVERRFQNPGQDRPIQPPAERLPLLIGLWEGDDLHSAGSPVLVAGDPDRRVGRATRFSVFVELAALLVAASTGWAETTSSSGERIVCLRPPSLPVLAEARDLGVSVSADRARFEIAQEEADPAPRHERRWRTTTTLVRPQGSRRRFETNTEASARCAGLGSGLSRALTSCRPQRRTRPTKRGMGLRCAPTITRRSTTI